MAGVLRGLLSPRGREADAAPLAAPSLVAPAAADALPEDTPELKHMLDPDLA
jgi:hypothetical protein